MFCKANPANDIIQVMDIREIRLGQYGLDSSAWGQGPVTCSCEHSNEISDSIKCENIV
jgi:hypothetical protein